MSTTREGIKMTGGSYRVHPHVDGVVCTRVHSGNRRLYQMGRDPWSGFECAKCMTFYSRRWVKLQQDSIARAKERAVREIYQPEGR